ncbi:MCE family protein [Kibdelosporangium phytohabitans]|uniref:ABC transporter substrate-binding protein n=1 Tax=Kibdelosporangium phytohabitans TaxID=860235 RepID=A0A0N9I8H7_9PSEU|nr:MCE family protein [Kibdelosporangium phytohabitans]ALG12635.1 ABC transporter substrate-binding protein [Kibdelosporangium phytohabitans]MBE1464281.1 virulence factor Mce-like protein [Kibdelosporangium phytohabitans]
MTARLRHHLLGLVFLAIIALFLALTIAGYRKAFTPVVAVSLKTDHAGNQMRAGADVKVRGMVVGEVRAIRAMGDHAVLDLALQPDKVDVIPANVSARLLPKTLFGERYVALQLPPQPETKRLTEGSVIPQDRSSSAIELERVLNDVLPVLQAVQPEKLSMTLNSISSALQGRGAQLGRTLVQLNEYLKQINPSLPDLTADIQALASVSGTFDKAAPDLLQALSDLTTTTKTVADEQANLRTLFGSVTNASVDLGNFVQVNKNNLVNLVVTARPTLEVLARYAPEYPCMLGQIADRVPAAEAAFGKGQAHPNMMRVTLEFTGNRGKYLPGVDTPRFDDKRGPRCYEQVELPAVFPQYPPGGPIKDGSVKPPPPRNQAATGIVPGSTSPQAAAGVANTPQELDVVSLLLAQKVGMAPEDVPRWTSFLMAPVYRGAEVTVE